MRIAAALCCLDWTAQVAALDASGDRVRTMGDAPRSVAVGGDLGLPAPAYSHKPITTNILFKNEIAQIFQRKCFQCHSDNNLSMSLTTYTEARPWARAIREEVLERKMPPWQAVPGYGHFANDISLNTREKEIILSWADGGAPSGVLKVEESIPPVYVPPAPTWDHGTPDHGAADRQRTHDRKRRTVRRSSASSSPTKLAAPRTRARDRAQAGRPSRRSPRGVLRRSDAAAGLARGRRGRPPSTAARRAAPYRLPAKREDRRRDWLQRRRGGRDRHERARSVLRRRAPAAVSTRMTIAAPAAALPPAHELSACAAETKLRRRRNGRSRCGPIQAPARGRWKSRATTPDGVVHAAALD